jgi:hypothetical protein
MFISKLIKMCQQLLHRHICNHTVCGLLIRCSTSTYVLHSPTHSFSPLLQFHLTPCPYCSNPALSRQAPAILMSPAITYPYNPIVYGISPASPFRGAFPQGSLSVPDSVHRDIRYEIIRGKLQPVEHFHFQGLPPPLTGKAGYNPLHGFDTGPLPPGWGPGSIEVWLRGVDFSKLGLSYNLAVSSGRGADGDSSDARGSTTSLPPTALNASSATPQQSQASNSEPTTSNNSSSAPQEPPTSTSQPSTSNISSAAPQQTPASGSESTSSVRGSGKVADGNETRGAST